MNPQDKKKDLRIGLLIVILLSLAIVITTRPFWPEDTHRFQSSESSTQTIAKPLSSSPITVQASQAEDAYSPSSPPVYAPELAEAATSIPLEYRQVLGRTQDRSYYTRNTAIDTILDRANPQDLSFLFQLMKTSRPKELNEAEWTAVHEIVAEFLVNEWPQSALAEQEFMRLLQDQSTPKTAKQAVLKRLDSIHRSSKQPLRVEEILWDYAKIQTDDISGVALVTLAKLDIDKEPLQAFSMEVVQASQSSLSTKITAFQIGNWLKAPNIQKVAIDIIQDAQQSTALQLAAIASVAASGNKDYIGFLSDLASKSTYPINMASQKAIDVIETNP